MLAASDAPSAPGTAGRSVLRTLLLLGAFGLALAGTLRIAAIPTERLALNIMVDDAFYYVVPARNLLAGRGYSLDGETRTNGVQPLWALITIGLCAVLRPGDAVPHALVLLSGLLWIGAGAVLYRILRRFDPWLALLTTTGFLLTGFRDRLAYQGMENGLHAFCCVLLMWVGARCLHPASEAGVRHDRPRFYLVLGLLLALVTLTRVDSGLLALIVWVLVLLGLVRPGSADAGRWNPRGAFWLALPGTVLVGGMLLFSHRYFGMALPISGPVKLHYQAAFGALHGGALGSVLYHLKLLWRITSAPVLQNVEHAAWAACGVTGAMCVFRNLLLLVLGAGAILAAAGAFANRGALKRPRPWHWYVAGLVLFSILHLGTYAITLSRFTDYGSWYFAPEIIGLWVLYGVCVVALGRWISRLRRFGITGSAARTGPGSGGGLACAAVVFMLAIGSSPVWATANDLAPVCAFYRAGRWMNQHLPAGSRIGSFSAGMVSYFASHQQVINLDGLMNDRTYFETYLKPGRIPQYVRRRDARFFSDYASAAAWRSGAYWSLDLSDMQILRWWPMANDLSYGVWRILPEGQHADVLEPCEAPCDRFSQVQFAADVLGRFRVVPEDRLDEYLHTPDGSAIRVVTSIIDPASRQLRHVLVRKDQAAGLGVTAGNIDIASPSHVTFGGAVRLLGYDIPDRAVRRGERFVITRYWTLTNPQHGYGDVSFELWANPALPQDYDKVPLAQRILHKSRACSGTYPLHEWRPGEVIAESYSFTIPREARPGSCPVMLVLWDPDKGWLLPDCPAANAARPGLLLANVDVR